MKIARTMLAVGWAIACIGITTAASAQPYRGHGYGHHHRSCHMEWRHHHRVRVCR